MRLMDKAKSVALMLVALLGSACAASSSSSSGAGSTVDSKYTQTWTTPYSQTTCAQWKTALTPSQQFAAAADMLTGARNKGDGGSGLPPDSLILTFAGGVTNACVIDTMNIAEVGAGLYLTERDRFRP